MVFCAKRLAVANSKHECTETVLRRRIVFFPSCRTKFPSGGQQKGLSGLFRNIIFKSGKQHNLAEALCRCVIRRRMFRNDKKCARRIISSLPGNFIGSRVCVLPERKNESDDPTDPDWLCRRGHGGGVCLEPADSCHGTGGEYGTIGVSSCGHRVLAGRPVPAGFGQDDPPSAPEQHAAGRPSYPSETDDHAGAGRCPS